MKWGLRAKLALALLACNVAALILATLARGQTIRMVEEKLGSAFARNSALFDRQLILTPVVRGLALSQQFADSAVTLRWLHDESDPQKKAFFFAEAERYRHSFEDHSYFIGSAQSRNYFYNDSRGKVSDRPRYRLKESDRSDGWFFNTLRSKRYNINIEPDVKLKVTKVWFNVPIVDGRGQPLGVAGSGLDLTTFLNRLVSRHEPGVTPILLNRKGEIQAHPDPRLIDYSSANVLGDRSARHSTIYRLLPRSQDREAARNALKEADRAEETIPTFWADLDGRRQLFAVSAIPELGWFAVSVVDLKTAQILSDRVWILPLLASVFLLLFLALAVMGAADRLLLTPLLRLTASARAMAGGDYAVRLPQAGSDELGELTRAFEAMAETVRRHTDELEARVRERTQELTSVNERMTAANRQIRDSIRYASLIQTAILPDEELSRALEGGYFALWKPKDVVGGDFYAFRASERGCLIGVADCAGHGVPGALMTMAAHAALNVAIDELGMEDPAALLERTDERLRGMLGEDPRYAKVATHMDAGLAYVDLEEGTVTYAGAKLSLYACDGERVEEIRGERRSVGGRRSGRRPAKFENRRTELDLRKTFYLTTDGLLDQSGGEKGYSLGNARFEAMLLRHSGRPFEEQREALEEELAAYQGERSQRDDITVLSFRFTRIREAAWTT